MTLNIRGLEASLILYKWSWKHSLPSVITAEIPVLTLKDARSFSFKRHLASPSAVPGSFPQLLLTSLATRSHKCHQLEQFSIGLQLFSSFCFPRPTATHQDVKTKEVQQTHRWFHCHLRQARQLSAVGWRGKHIKHLQQSIQVDLLCSLINRNNL